MTQIWPETLLDLGRTSGIGTILHLGAAASDPAAALSSPARRVALVLPAPLAEAGLQRRVEGEPRAVLYPVAIGVEAGRAPLDLFNFPALSSLKAPSEALRALFPNLRPTGRIEVEVETFADIVARVPLEVDGSNVLVIDMPGAEAEILRGLAAAAPERFGTVILRAGLDSMYDGGLPFQDLVALLEEAGYRRVRQDDSDPDFPVARFRLEPLVLELRAVRAECAEENRKRKAAEARAGTLKAERDKAREERDAARADIARLESARAQEQALNESLRAEFHRVEVQMEILRELLTSLAHPPSGKPSRADGQAPSPTPARRRGAATGAKRPKPA